MSRLLIGLIRIYQRWISPFKPRTCRFYPTCSHYAVEALETHGLVHGGYLATRRLLRCHPLHPGGYDPVPPKKTRLRLDVELSAPVTEES